MAFELDELNTIQLVDFLKARDVPQVICDSVKENDIDGTTLLCLVNDQTEFVTLFPKSGHRLHLKRVVNNAVKKQLQGSQIAMEPERNQLEDGFPVVDDLVDFVNLDSSNAFSSSIDIFNAPLSSTSCMPDESSPFHEVTLSPVAPVEPTKTPDGPKPPHVPATEEASTSKPASSSKGLPVNLPFPDRFSIRVENAIQAGNVLRVRRQLIADIATFYLGLCNTPQQGDYKRVAVMVCEKFPELKDSNASSFWVSVQKQLSQYFRNQRQHSNPSTSSSKEGEEGKVPASKRAKVAQKTVDDPVTQKRNLELLRDYKVGSMSAKTFSTLVEDTFTERRKFIQIEAKSCSEILEMCPYLGKSENVRKEMKRIVPDFEFEKSVERLSSGFKKVLRKEDMNNKNAIDAVKFIETKTMRKGATIIKFKDPSTKPENLFRDKMVEFRLVCLGTPDDVGQTFVSGEDKSFFESSKDIVEALVDLSITYYVFDVSYPDAMAGILYFIQDISLEIKDNIPRSIKYSTLMAELRSGVHTVKT